MFQLKQSGGMWLGAFSLFPEEGLVHGVSTRFGGVSKAPFASLNMALHTGDSPSDVWENRRLFAEVLQVDAERIVTPRQVHGDEIHIVQASDAGMGAKRFDESVFACDALLTQEPDIPLMLCFADCVPLLFLIPCSVSPLSLMPAGKERRQGSGKRQCFVCRRYFIHVRRMCWQG